MTNLTDQQRAEGLVEAGILKLMHAPLIGHTVYTDSAIADRKANRWSAERAVREPSVAMECLKRMTGADLFKTTAPNGVMNISAFDFIWLQDERAIVDAYLEGVK